MSSTHAQSVEMVHRVERELLLLCARTMVNSVVDAQINALLEQDLDWNFLITTAHQHRVLPLVHRTLSRPGLGSVPESASSRLRSAFQANVKRNLFLTSELFSVMDLLGANGIQSIPYKGPVLTFDVYGDLSLRQFADLDIIVPTSDVVKARSLLVSRGYRPEKPLSDDQLLALLQPEKDITLLHDGLGVNLEIHWGITSETDPIRIQPEWLWADLGSCAVAGRKVPTLSREDLLLVLCVHGAKHRWERLGWLCDVAEIARSRKALQWDRAVETAVRVGGERILFLGLSLAKDLLGANPPADVVAAIQNDRVVQHLSAQVKEWLFSEEPVTLDLGEREQFFMRLRERRADRLRVALKQAKLYLAPTLRDNETLLLPKNLRWPLYVLRPFRLAWEYGFTPFKRFCKGLFQP